MRLLKWLFAALVLAIVVCAECDPKSTQIISQAALEGLLGGVCHRLIGVASRMERRPCQVMITGRRLLNMLREDVRVGLVAGLLLGILWALISLLS